VQITIHDKKTKPYNIATTKESTAKLCIEAKDGTVWFGNEKYKDNGKFSVEINFYILIGDEPITLMNISSLYYSYGCPSLSTTNRRLIIDSKDIFLDYEGELTPHLVLNSGGRNTINYIESFHPPLKCTTPADCDDGDMKVCLSWRTSSELKTQKTKRIFIFTNATARKIEISSELRKPPRITTEELKAWYAEGKLSEEEFNHLIKINPVTRYMEAFSDNETIWIGSQIGFNCLKKLRKLVGNPHRLKI